MSNICPIFSNGFLKISHERRLHFVRGVPSPDFGTSSWFDLGHGAKEDIMIKLIPIHISYIYIRLYIISKKNIHMP